MRLPPLLLLLLVLHRAVPLLLNLLAEAADGGAHGHGGSGAAGTTSKDAGHGRAHVSSHTGHGQGRRHRSAALQGTEPPSLERVGAAGLGLVAGLAPPDADHLALHRVLHTAQQWHQGWGVRREQAPPGIMRQQQAAQAAVAARSANHRGSSVPLPALPQCAGQLLLLLLPSSHAAAAASTSCSCCWCTGQGRATAQCRGAAPPNQPSSSRNITLCSHPAKQQCVPAAAATDKPSRAYHTSTTHGPRYALGSGLPCRRSCRSTESAATPRSS